MTKTFWIVIICLLLGFVGGIGLWYFVTRQNQKQVQEDQTVLLERIKKVAKLITVEGYFTELYSYKDYYYWDINPLRKKVILRIKAKVSVGIDLQDLKIEMDQDNKIMKLYCCPPPEILSIDTDLDYYDLSEGTFNSFNEDDYNALQKKAKAFIKSVAEKSDLMQQSTDQSIEFLEIVKGLATSGGWEVIILPSAQLLQK
jgi:preprotein translocase subunit YajC